MEAQENRERDEWPKRVEIDSTRFRRTSDYGVVLVKLPNTVTPL